MVDGTDQWLYVIKHIFLKILFIIDKFVPLAVTLNNQFIALLYIHISAAEYELFIYVVYMSFGVNKYVWRKAITTNYVMCILMSSIIPFLSILNIWRLGGLTALEKGCLFNFKIAMHSHVPTVFFMFPQFFTICSLFNISAYPTIISNLNIQLFLHSLKQLNVLFFPMIFSLCSLASQTFWETLINFVDELSMVLQQVWLFSP